MNSKSKTTTPRESILSVLILLILVLIATAVFFRQFRFNPAVYIIRDGGMQTSALAEKEKRLKIAALIELPPGISPLSASETFTAESLSDKIDGKAELYLSAGFKKLQSQRYRIQDKPALWMEIFIFDMGSHENAFAVYSTQQRQDAIPAGLGPLSYRTENALYWVHGQYYIEFIAADASSTALQRMMTIGERFNRSVAVASRSIAGPKLFPRKGLISQSINLIAADAFGYADLDRVYTAEYRIEDSVLTAFVSHRSSPAAAEALAADYRNFLIRFGGRSIPIPKQVQLANAGMIEILGYFEIVFYRGPFLAGIHEAADSRRALDLAERLDKTLQEHFREKTE